MIMRYCLLLQFRTLLRNCLLFQTLNNYYDTKFRIKQMSHKEGREANMEMRTGACAVNQWLWSCYCKINVDFVYSPQHRSIPVNKTAPDWPQNGVL